MGHWLERQVPVLRVALISAAGGLALVFLVQPWRGWSAFRSAEILIVPTLAAILLLPIYGLWRIVPERLPSWWRGLGRTQRSLLQDVVPVLLLVGLVWTVFGPLWGAKWGIIDDREIMGFLIPSGKLALSEVPSRLASTEVGSFGNSARYRPAYYTLRLLETALWGPDPTLWYLARIGMLLSGGVVFWILARRVMGGIGATLVVAYALSIPIWGDIVGRLGPSEAYALLGLPLFLAGVMLSLERKDEIPSRQVLPAALLALGGVVCAGSKENFLILMLPATYLLYVAVRRKQWLILAAAGLVLVFAGVVASSVMIATTRSGVDVYGRSISLTDRFATFFEVIVERKLVTPFTMLVGLTLSLGVLHTVPGISGPKRIHLFRAQGWLALLCLLYLSESVFYGGDWTSLGGHYGYPVFLYLPATIVVLYWLAHRLVPGFVGSERTTGSVSIAFLLAIVVTVAFHRSFSGTTSVVHGNVNTTVAFTDSLDRLVERLREDPDLQLVIEGSGDVWLDAEPLPGLSQFLRAYQVQNSLYMRIHGYSSEEMSQGFNREMAAALEQVSRHGDDFFSPLRDINDREGRCLSVFIGPEFPTPCEVFQWDGDQVGIPRLQ